MGEVEAGAEGAVRLPGQVGLQPRVLVAEVGGGTRQRTAVGRYGRQEDGQEEVHGQQHSGKGQQGHIAQLEGPKAAHLL